MKQMQTLGECISEAQKRGVAIGHFNISDIVGLWAVVGAARELKVPVIIGVSEGERDFIGVSQVAALVKSVREESNLPIFLNADHTYSFDRVKEAIDAGFDSVIIDGAKLSEADNITLTKECVAYARGIDSNIIVEGELGYIGTSSQVLVKVPAGAALKPEELTTPEQAASFVRETGVDLLAPAVGNIHGMLAGAHDPALDIERIREIRKAAGVPLVLHGASGNTDEDLKQAIAAGVAIIHINTELRVAYRDALKLSLQDNPDEVAPYKFMKPAVQAMEEVVAKKLKVFNNL